MAINNRKRNIDPEELLKEAEAEVAKAEELPVTQEEPIEEKIEEEVEEQPIEEVVEEAVEEEVVVEEKPKQEKPQVDYKEKFSQSSKEAMALHFKNQKLEEILDSAVEVPEPTEAELIDYARAKGSLWEDLDEFSKGILKDTFKNNRALEKIRLAREESRKVEDWARKVEGFVNSEETISKFPSLEDLGEDFKRFAMRESRRGMDLEDLVASFLYNAPQVPVKKNKGSLLLSRGNGRTVTEVPTGLTAEQVEIVRRKDPKEYRRLIKAGKINFEI